jgi:hypothetical protein
VRLRPHGAEKIEAYAATRADEPSLAEALRRMAGFEVAPVKRGGRRAYAGVKEEGNE